MLAGCVRSPNHEFHPVRPTRPEPNARPNHSKVLGCFADNPIVNKWRLAAIKGQSGNRRMPANNIHHTTGMSCNQKAPQGVLKERVSYGNQYEHRSDDRCKQPQSVNEQPE
jgi:hypothetical protein